MLDAGFVISFDETDPTPTHIIYFACRLCYSTSTVKLAQEDFPPIKNQIWMSRVLRFLVVDQAVIDTGFHPSEQAPLP